MEQGTRDPSSTIEKGNPRRITFSMFRLSRTLVEIFGDTTLSSSGHYSWGWDLVWFCSERGIWSQKFHETPRKHSGGWVDLYSRGLAKSDASIALWAQSCCTFDKRTWRLHRSSYNFYTCDKRGRPGNLYGLQQSSGSDQFYGHYELDNEGARSLNYIAAVLVYTMIVFEKRVFDGTSASFH